MPPVYSGTKPAYVPTANLTGPQHARGIGRPTGQNVAGGRLAVWRGTAGC